MANEHPYKYMVDNGVIADPLMKDWTQFDSKLFDRMLAPHIASELPLSEAVVQKIKNMSERYSSVRKTLYALLDELNDPLFFPNDASSLRLHVQ